MLSYFSATFINIHLKSIVCRKKTQKLLNNYYEVKCNYLAIFNYSEIRFFDK